ncbi:DUF2345 domain-containing protein, partial [Xanthomonas oryzae]
LAQQKIVLQAGRTSITLEGGNITFACPGTFTVKAGQHPFMGGQADGAELPELPYSLMQPMPYSLRWQTLSAVTAAPTADVDVVISENNISSQAQSLKTSSDGRTERLRDDRRSHRYEAFIGSGGWSMLWTGEHSPEPKDPDDWMDWEAEENEGASE